MGFSACCLIICGFEVGLLCWVGVLRGWVFEVLLVGCGVFRLYVFRYGDYLTVLVLHELAVLFIDVARLGF